MWFDKASSEATEARRQGISPLQHHTAEAERLSKEIASRVQRGAKIGYGSEIANRLAWHRRQAKLAAQRDD
jgi:hypothetical protein